MIHLNHFFIMLSISCLAAHGQTPLITGTSLTNDHVRITWADGIPPFQVVAVEATNSTVVAGPIDERTATLPALRSNVMLRVDALGEPAPQTASYTITFQNTWTAQNHPVQFPAGDHYSFFNGAVHNDSVSFWSPGTLATTGMKNMAERGSNFALGNEFQAAIDQSQARERINLLNPINVSQTFPLVTFVAMVAPSPDWFVGVHDLALFDGTNWVEDLTVTLYPYDAGTDSGVSYNSGDVATTPPVPIFEITGAPFLNNGTVHPLGTFRFLRQ